MWRKHERKLVPIPIGVLVATSGASVEFDRPTLDGVLAAIEVANADTKTNDRPLLAVVRDTAGDPAVAARAAEGLVKEGVGVMIGGASPSVRRAIETAIAPLGALLVSPISPEGLDRSPALITLGTLPNQRAVPAAAWAVTTLGKRAFLIANDGVLQRVVDAILHDHVTCVGGEIVGGAWIRERGGDEAKDVASAVAAILKAKPDVIISGLNRASTVALLTALRSARVKSVDTPMVNWQLRLGELKQIDGKLIEGDYLVASTLASDDDLGEEFAAAYATQSGGAIADARAAAAVAAVELVRQAIERSGGVDPKGVRAAMLGASVPSAGGATVVDAASGATWKMAHIARIGADGSVSEVWASAGAIRPRPWPVWRSRSEWMSLLANPSASPPAVAPATPPAPAPSRESEAKP